LLIIYTAISYFEKCANFSTSKITGNGEENKK